MSGRLVAKVTLVALFLSIPATRSLANSYLADFESGQRALRYSSWDEAAFWFRRAAEKRPKDGGPPARLSGRNYVAYLPYYFLGFALFQGGRYHEALKTWDTAEAQWQDEDWLTKSKGLDEYRDAIGLYRKRYEREVFPTALQSLSSYLGDLRALISQLKPLVSRSAPGVAAEIEAAEAQLSRWSERSATMRGDYHELDRLTREVVEALDRLEVIQACFGADAAQPWCRLDEPSSFTGNTNWYPVKWLEGARFNQFRMERSMFEDVPQGLFMRPQDVAAVRGLYSKKYALLISPTYTRWEPILSAAPKLGQLQKTLQQLGFEVEVLAKPLTKEEMQDALLAFFNKNAPLVADKPNLLFVHFIGHGYSLASNAGRLGMLVASNAPGPRGDPAAIAKAAVFEGFFRGFTSRPVHHIVFTFETCSSGQFLDELMGPNPKDWRGCFKSPAFLVLTAGDIDEVGSLKQLPLTDELIRAFSGCGQRGREVVLNGYLIFRAIQGKIISRFRNRNPQFRRYIFDGHREGDFIMIIPDRCQEPKVAA